MHLLWLLKIVVQALLTMQMTEKASKDFNWQYSHAVSIFGGIGWCFCFDHTRSHPIDPINQQHNKLERVGTIHFFKHCLLVLPTENCCSLCIVPWSMPWQGGISATFYNILWSREEGVCVVRQSITVKLKKILVEMLCRAWIASQVALERIPLDVCI